MTDRGPSFGREEVSDRVECDVGGILDRVAVDACADGAEGLHRSSWSDTKRKKEGESLSHGARHAKRDQRSEISKTHDRLEPFVDGCLEAALVARAEKSLALVAVVVVEDRADGVRDPLGGQLQSSTWRESEQAHEVDLGAISKTMYDETGLGTKEEDGADRSDWWATDSEGVGQFGLPRLGSIEQPARLLELRTGSRMNRSIDPST